MFLHFQVKDSSNAGEIRRQTAQLSLELNFNQIESEKISIVINEMCSNILKHAKSGEVIISKDSQSIHLLALDKGPGMSNLVECLKDGYSTQGTQGTGLGAMKRQSTFFDLFTASGKGTVLYSRFTPSDVQLEDAVLDVGAVMIPYPGENVCGDGWSLLPISSIRQKLLVCDGLGHGLLANAASETAKSAFKAGNERAPLEDISALHNALRSTRGAAIAIADIHLEKEKLDYAGMGNISAGLISRKSVKKLISYNGTAGVQLRKVQAMTYPLEDDWILVMHSDGLGTQWSLSDYPGLQLKHPLIIAGVLYRDFTRKTDDVTVVVVRKKC